MDTTEIKQRSQDVAHFMTDVHKLYEHDRLIRYGLRELIIGVFEIAYQMGLSNEGRGLITK